MARVLLVDDDEDTRILLAEDVRDLGHEPISATDGYQAFALARQEQPALIILDYRLPGGSGADVLSRLKRSVETSTIPVIVFSRQRSPEIRDEVLGLGAHAFVPKSFANGELRERIVACLARRADPGPELRLAPIGDR